MKTEEEAFNLLLRNDKTLKKKYFIVKKDDRLFGGGYTNWFINYINEKNNTKVLALVSDDRFFIYRKDSYLEKETISLTAGRIFFHEISDNQLEFEFN